MSEPVITKSHHSEQHGHTITSVKAEKTAIRAPLTGVTEGRIVHFVLPNGLSAGAHRPAIIVHVIDATQGYVNLQVFTDGSNDGKEYANGIHWATSVSHSDEHKPRTWHFIEPGPGA